MKKRWLGISIGISIFVGCCLLALVIYLKAPSDNSFQQQQGYAGILFFLGLIIGGTVIGSSFQPQTGASSQTQQATQGKRQSEGLQKGRGSRKKKLPWIGLGVGIILAACLTTFLIFQANQSLAGFILFAGLLTGIIVMAFSQVSLTRQPQKPKVAAREKVGTFKPVGNPMGERTVRLYVVDSFAMKMGVMDRIEQRKEWAVVQDIYEHPDRPYWEIWVDGKLKDTVFSQREAEEDLRKYLSGEYT